MAASTRRTERTAERETKHGHESGQELPPSLPNGVNTIVVDVVGGYVLKRDREIFKRLEAYDREERKRG